MNPFDHPDILNEATPFEIAAGNIIMLADEVPDYVYLLERGEALVQELLPDGRWRILHRVFPGEVFGHFEIITDERLICSVFARSDCAGLRLRASEFLALLKTKPDISFFVLQGIARMISDSSVTTIDKAGNPTLLRVASCVLDNSGFGGAIELSRQEIADRACCSLRSVHRCVKRLSALGLLENENGALRVPDRDRLLEFIQSQQR